MALEKPSAIVGESDAEKLQENIDKYAPFDEGGEIDLSGYKPVKSKVEEKIAEINKWLEENASWLKAVFGMVPSFTILFFVNFYFILLFLTILVFNGKSLFGFIDGLTKEIDLGFIETTWANIMGIVVFLILHITKTTVSLAKIATNAWILAWEKLLILGIAVAIIVGVIALIVLAVLYMYFPQVLRTFEKKREEAKEKKAKRKQDLDRQALDTIIQKATQDA